MLKDNLYIRTGIAVLSAAMLYSCAEKTEGGFTPQPSDVVYVAPDSVKVDTVFHSTCMVVNDGKLIVMSRKTTDMLYSFSVPGMEFVNEGLREGQGPDELVTVNPKSLANQDKGLVSVYTVYGTVAMIDANTLKIADKKNFALPEGCRYAQHVCPVGRDRALVQDGEVTSKWYIADADGKVDATVDVKIPDGLIPEGEGSDYARLFAYSAVPVVSEKAQRFAICFGPFPQMSIYDFKGKLVRNILFEFDMQPLGNPTGLSYAINTSSTDAGFYVNSGIADGDRKYSAIYFIGWDGKPLKKYVLPTLAAAFAVDQESKTVYYEPYPENDYIMSFKL